MRNYKIRLLWNTGFRLEQSKAPEKTSILNKIVNNVIPKTNANDDDFILDKLNLSDCRVTQYEDKHILKWRGSMYAYDIACEVWKSFKVYSPIIKDIYVVEHIWFDSKLGDYIILKHWELRFVYWHTLSNLKVGTALKSGQEIWYTNKTWVSQNYHLHIELWKWKENISWKYIKWEWLHINPKSLTLREQRWFVSDAEINTMVFEFISAPSREWFSLKAYQDWTNPDWSIRYSIGYWTKSYAWEVITKEEAIKRSRVKIQEIRTRYQLSKQPINVQIWLTSFIYDIWSLSPEQIRFLNNGYYKALVNDMQLYVNSWGEKLLGLVNRRNDEGIIILKI